MTDYIKDLDEVVRLAGLANLPQLEACTAHVCGPDGDTIADCFYNVANNMEGDDVAASIAAAVNYIRQHAEAIRRHYLDAYHAEMLLYRALPHVMNDSMGGPDITGLIMDIQKHLEQRAINFGDEAAIAKENERG